MSLHFSSGTHYVTIDWSRVRDSIGDDEVRIRETAASFHENEERLLSELKESLTNGREPNCRSALKEMEGLASGLFTEPMTTLCRRGKFLMSSKHTNDQMNDLVSQLETALQGTVNLLRSEGLLRGDFDLTSHNATEKD